MASGTENCKIWIRFESKRDGQIVKLRIQDLPSNRVKDFITFYTKYFIRDEAFHKAAGIVNNPEAINEYANLLNMIYDHKHPEIAICCLDDDEEDFKEILAVSTVQLTTKDIGLVVAFKKMGIEVQTDEVKALFHIASILKTRFPESVIEKYKCYHEGRGIIVHPDYRGLGIATQIVKQRRLLIQDLKVPMTCATMTSVGSQKAAEKDGWETVAEISLEEMEQLSGFFFVKNVPTFKLMMATLN